MVILAPLHSRKRRKMQGLTSNELAVLLKADAGYRLSAILVMEGEQSLWELRIASADGKKTFFLQAARGGVRRWKGLNWLASFIEQTYPQVRSFDVILSRD
ncbi:MobD [Burkholderia cepacia]|uniref:MobD n=2 Tax=Burkholderia cepacia TaxID=292 RepID=A0AAX2RA18_BURCE|nr:MobD [Burkholderia cepacia]TEU30950.1 MobD [Burkholderia cepacia]TEU31781.1 MobD [Burkholderia cepacia]TEU81832.1 MobD [Burkholderia cepacia]TEU92042.1 MobD [Burkholderia cepacia]